MNIYLRTLCIVVLGVTLVMGWTVTLAHFFGNDVPISIHLMAGAWTVFTLEAIAERLKWSTPAAKE